MKTKLQNFSCLFFSLTISLGLVAQVEFLNETFSGTSIPDGWTQETSATDGGWKAGSATALSSEFWTIPPHDGNMAATNDDECNCDKSNDFLISPEIDLDTALNALLSYDYFYNGGTYQGDTESFKLEISLDGGETWEILEDVTPVGEWTTRLIDLTQYIGEKIHLGFRYNDDGGWLFGAAIDNVNVSEVVKYDLVGVSSDIQPFMLFGDPVSISGVLKNLGSDTITSLDLNYVVNDGDTINAKFNDLSIPLTKTFEFTHPIDWIPDGTGEYTIKIWADSLNGNADENPDNDLIIAETYVANELAQRKVLFEQFTSNTCVPCASSDPQIMSFLDNNDVNTENGKMVALKYHMNFPNPGTDQAYTAESGARFNYYGATGVPHASLGNVYSGHPLNLTQTIVDDEYNRPAVFDIDLWGICEDTNQVEFEIDLKSYVNFNESGVRLHAIIMEREITDEQFDPSPTTTQKLFKFVMRKMLPNSSGTLVQPMTEDEIRNFSFNYKLNNSITNDPHNLALIVFVQNASTKEVYQAEHIDIKSYLNTNNLSLDNSLSLFPNPANTSTTLVFEANADNAHVEIVNMAGQNVFSQNLGTVNGQTKITIPTSNFENGLYIVNLRSNNGVVSKKLSVIR